MKVAPICMPDEPKDYLIWTAFWVLWGGWFGVNPCPSDIRNFGGLESKTSAMRKFAQYSKWPEVDGAQLPSVSAHVSGGHSGMG